MRYSGYISAFLFLCIPRLSEAQVVINELSAAKQNVHKDRYNEYDDWVEFYNAGDSTVSMAGYFVSDDPDVPTLTQLDPHYAGFYSLEPGAYLVFFCDRGTRQQGALHLDLKLSSGGETLWLYNADTVLVDSIDFGQQKNYMSYGRMSDGGSSWGFFPAPSPNARNQYGYELGCTEPAIDIHGGFYDEPFELYIDHDQRDEVYYTTDGTVPSNGNGTRYTTPIRIDSTMVVRAVALREEYLPSTVISHTYFIGYEPTLPVFSLSTDHMDMITNTDPTANIYDERPIHVEFFEQDGSFGFRADMGFRLVGKAIRNYPQKSFAFRARSGYGTDLIRYPLFAPQKDIEAFADFALRNSGNDNSRTMMRDGFMQTLAVGKLDVDGQAYKPCIVFVNGEYWGIHNLREKISGAFVEQNHPESGGKIDMFEWGSQPIQGTMDHIIAFDAFVADNDFTDPSNYDSLCKLMDMSNFIDYQLSEIYYGNTDWPMANMKFWRPTAEGGLWRWIIFDVDLAYELDKKFCPGHHNTLQYALGVNNCHLDHLTNSLTNSTILLQKLILNETFRERFISRAMTLLNTHFSSATATATLDVLTDQVRPEMPNHIAKWGTLKGIPTMDRWEQEIDHLYRFAEERPDTLRGFFEEEFEMGQRYELIVHVSEGATIYVNDEPVMGNDPMVFYNDIPVSVRMELDEGYIGGGFLEFPDQYEVTFQPRTAIKEDWSFNLTPIIAIE